MLTLNNCQVWIIQQEYECFNTEKKNLNRINEMKASLFNQASSGNSYNSGIINKRKQSIISELEKR